MKKLAVLLMTATLVFSLAGCGNQSEENGGSQSQESSVSDTATEPVSEPASQPEPDQQPEDGSAQAPEGDPAQTPDEGISEQMGAIRQAVVDALGDDYWPDTQIPADFLEGYGLTDGMYADFWGEMPMIGTNVDTLIVIQASEGQIDAVEAVLNSYRDTQVNDTMQYPMNLGKVQASQVGVIGDYACFVQLGADTMEFMDEGDEAVIRHCQEVNEMVLKTIEGVVQQ